MEKEIVAISQSGNEYFSSHTYSQLVAIAEAETSEIVPVFDTGAAEILGIVLNILDGPPAMFAFLVPGASPHISLFSVTDYAVTETRLTFGGGGSYDPEAASANILPMALTGSTATVNKSAASVLALCSSQSKVIFVCNGVIYNPIKTDTVNLTVDLLGVDGDTLYYLTLAGSSSTTMSGTITTKTNYVLPSGGIPSTDMSSAVQTSLGRADSAYQKPGTGIPDGDLAIYETTITQSGSSWQSNHSLADIIVAYNYEKQLRFYNGSTQLTPIEFTGSYITLAGVYPSSGRALLRLFAITSSGVGVSEYPIGDAFKPTDVQVSGSTPTITAEDNHVYSCGEITSLTITDSAQNISFKVDFTSGSTATVINAPSGYKAPGGDLTAEANKEYELDVRNGKAVLTAFEAVSAGA